MFSQDAVESAYCFFHQKWNIYSKSQMEWQRDDIEYAIESYCDAMNQELFNKLSQGNKHFLHEHTTFYEDIQTALKILEEEIKDRS